MTPQEIEAKALRLTDIVLMHVPYAQASNFMARFHACLSGCDTYQERTDVLNLLHVLLDARIKQIDKLEATP